MAIAPTGAIYKSLIFDGEDSRNYGVYITGEAVYNAPGRDVEMVEIPGRNGSFALDKGRFQNIEVSYPAGIFADNETDFAEAISDFRNFLCSRRGYVRLTDEYNPNEYRMAIYKSGLEVSPAQLKAGEFTIVFDCKPQRWLTSGEDAVTMGEYTEVAGTDNEPYLFRASPQFSDEYDTEIDKIVGGTVAWNQLAPNNYSRNSNGSTAFATGTPIVAGHKYLLTRKLSTSASVMVTVYTNDGSNRSSLVIDETTTATIKQAAFSGVSNGTGSAVEGNAWLYQYHPNGSVVTVTDLNIIDLTAMFGTTIADAIYAMEQATAGSGVAYFKSLGFNKAYYPYDAGTLKSVEGVSAHVMTDSIFHDRSQLIQAQFDPNTGTYDPNGGNASRRITLYKLPVDTTKGNQITIEVGNSFQIGSGAVYDSSGNYLQSLPLSAWTTNSATFDIRSDAHYFSTNFRKTSDTLVTPDEITPHISYGTSVTKHSYPLDSTLTLRGIPKWNNGLYYDGDVYSSDGTVTRKYVELTFDGSSDENWGKESASWNNNGLTIFYIKLATAGYYENDSAQSHLICNRLETTSTLGLRRTENYGYISFTGNSTYVEMAIDLADVSALRTQLANNPLTIVYELATPTTETADPYTSPQIVDAYGTEEYVSTSIVPVGHDTQYGENPNVLFNPTLFESSPLLEVKGNGTIGFNGYEIDVANAELGEIYLAIEKTAIPNPTAYSDFSNTLLNSGDDIYIDGITVYAWTAQAYALSATNSNANFSTTFRKDTSVDYDKYIVATKVKPFTAKLGTVYEANDTVTIQGLQSLSSGTFTATINIVVRVDTYYSPSDRSFCSVTPTVTTTSSGDGACYKDNVSFGTIRGYSTQPIPADPAYIDCEIGEAYAIDGGTVVSLNRIIDLGSDLPKLASGVNEITYDNTITKLKIHPRWWKV